ncbi:hypothetical protein [Natrinema sp. 74]|uniref:hypothetical protein n=1 Tax=Natrinema sp. 74 TaxID=3384159 RepID=UPI0038D3A17C
MLEYLIDYTLVCFGVLVAGFLTTKISLYGLLTTAVVWVCYTMVPSLSSATVIGTMWPRFIDLWTLYPRIIEMMLSQGWAEFGMLGAVIYGLISIMPLFPYISGLISGLFFWPELIILRVL